MSVARPAQSLLVIAPRTDRDEDGNRAFAPNHRQERHGRATRGDWSSRPLAKPQSLHPIPVHHSNLETISAVARPAQIWFWLSGPDRRQRGTCLTRHDP